MAKNKVNFDITSVNSNAFSLMGHFRNQAKIDGWTKEEIDEVLNTAMHGDYDHLIATLMEHINVDVISG